MSGDLQIVGKALHDVLQPFRECQQKILTAVLQYDDEQSETIVLVFGTDALSLTSDPDLDVLTVSLGPLGDVEAYDDLTADAPWSRFIGKPFFWGWLTTNQRGHTDGALMSFDGVVPEIGVNVVASSLETLLVSRASQ